MATYGEVTITGSVTSGNGEIWFALVSITGGVVALTLLGSTDAVQQRQCGLLHRLRLLLRSRL
jgi:hypothetical protein